MAGGTEYAARYSTAVLGGEVAGALAATVTGLSGWPVPAVLLSLLAVLAWVAVAAQATRLLRGGVPFAVDPTGVHLAAQTRTFSLRIRRSRRLPAITVPWADVQAIEFFPERVSSASSARAEVTHHCVGVRLKAGVPAERYGGVPPLHPEPAAQLAAQSRPPWVCRRMAGWRVRRDALAAVLARCAPEVAVADGPPDDDPRAGQLDGARADLRRPHWF